MIGLLRDNNFYIRIPKNGISTFYDLLLRHGYRQINIFDTELDPSQLKMWGHLTEPMKRHTKGVAEFLQSNPDIDYLNPMIGKMLVTGMFDSHTYTVNMMLGHLITYPITWIPLDAEIKKFNPNSTLPEILDGDQLTNLYFEEQNLEFRVTKDDHRNVANEEDIALRKIVENYKTKHYTEYQQLIKNVLEADLLLYHRTLLQYYKKFG